MTPLCTELCKCSFNFSAPSFPLYKHCLRDPPWVMCLFIRRFLRLFLFDKERDNFQSRRRRNYTFFCRLSAMIAHAPLGLGCFRLLGIENRFFFDIFCHGIMKENLFFEYIDSQLIPIPTFFAIEPALLPLSVLSVARRHFNEFVAVSVKEVWYGKQRRVSYCSFQ